MVERSIHSIKVPRLFKAASKIVKIVKEEGGSVKEQVYSGKHPNIKALYALVVETLQHEKQLTKILEHSKLLQQEPKLDPWLARVLMTELLWGKKRLSGESKPVKTILSYQSSFIVDDDDKDAKDPTQKKDNVEVQLPRYARVNKLYMTVEEAVAYFRDEGWLLAKKGDKGLFPSSDHFRCDVHIPEVLAFPPGTQLYQHPLYRDSSILLQDKASCLASHLLSPHPGSVVLDMCAAPGMKTTHLAAIMKNEGTIYAVEKDLKRYKTLCNFVEQTGATCVKTLQEDSVQLSTESVPDVEYILVDPSCSGSGMVKRVEVGIWEDNGSIEAQNRRLRKLVGFQKRILYHALTCFPAARRVLYSTCSVMTTENEEVVSFALTKQLTENFSWRLVNLFPEWPSRGCEDVFPGIGNRCIYSRTDVDLTNGFFMAMFERGDSSSAQQEIHSRDNILEQSKEKCAEEEGDKSEKVKKKRRKKGKDLDGECLEGEGECLEGEGRCLEGEGECLEGEGECLEGEGRCLEGEGDREDRGSGMTEEGKKRRKKKKKKKDEEEKDLNGECLEGEGECLEGEGRCLEGEGRCLEGEGRCLEGEGEREDRGSAMIEEGKKRRKKKKKKKDEEEKDLNGECLEGEGEKEDGGGSGMIGEGEKRKKKKKRGRMEEERGEEIVVDVCVAQKNKKRKKIEI